MMVIYLILQMIFDPYCPFQFLFQELILQFYLFVHDPDPAYLFSLAFQFICQVFILLLVLFFEYSNLPFIALFLLADEFDLGFHDLDYFLIA
jgi:hypothetical protein